MFKCSFCGKEYENALDRARCEIRCDEKIKTELEQERQEKLKLEKDKRIEEVDNAYDEYRSTCYNSKEKYIKIMEKYCNDYNINFYNTNNKIYAPCSLYDIIDQIVFKK